MKHINPFILLCLMIAVSSCSSVYKNYTIVKPQKMVSSNTYNIQSLKIYNPEILLLSEGVLSNSIFNVLKVVMAKSGFTYSTNADLQIKLGVSLEENDIINNSQSLSLFMDFCSGDSPFANFIIYSKTKQLLLDKEMFINEMESVMSILNNSKNEWNDEKSRP